MKKIISLFKRDYEGNRQVYNEITPGAEWVANGEGVATIKYDGTCCKVENGKLYKRYDRKLSKSANNRKKQDADFIPTIDDFKPAPQEWKAAEAKPNEHTGHWPGWLPVSETDPNDKYHIEVFNDFNGDDGTYELVGPKIQGNPYGLSKHYLWKHGVPAKAIPPRDFNGIYEYFENIPFLEGIVWHHPDGRMVKIKRRDFGLQWPIEDK